MTELIKEMCNRIYQLENSVLDDTPMILCIEKRRKRKKHSVVQTHHISYSPEVTVKLYKGEHWIITQLTRRKNVSKGFIKALKLWIKSNEKKAAKL